MKKRVLLFLLLGLLVLAACGGDSNDGGIDTGSFKTVTDEELGFTMGYPEEWVSRGGEGDIQLATSQELFDSPDKVEEGALIIVTGFEKVMVNMLTLEEVDVEDPVALLNVFSQIVLEGDDATTIREDAKAITLNNYPAAQMTIDAISDTGEGVYGQLTAVPNAEAVIYIFAATPQAQEEEMRPIFEAMYSTIQLSAPHLAAVGK
ncbi:MAG TPA: hypothetical protein PLD25_20265 [Chloroflexota bacterium]|nr:hypothetical protein [Chloroflexota bacterium]HUM70132.1 hypothetical protein [Chloroflexota bacterium]